MCIILIKFTLLIRCTLKSNNMLHKTFGRTSALIINQCTFVTTAWALAKWKVVIWNGNIKPWHLPLSIVKIRCESFRHNKICTWNFFSRGKKHHTKYTFAQKCQIWLFWHYVMKLATKHCHRLSYISVCRRPRKSHI